MAILLTIFTAAAVTIFVLGLQTLACVPLTIAYAFWKHRFLHTHRAGFTPFLSVIVPAYNEEQTIVASVSSILNSDYPVFEIIVVDDGSDDQTAEVLLPLAEAGEIVYVRKTNGGKASALNAGIAIANGEVIVYTDADSFFRTDTLRNLARWFVDPRVDAVCGNDTPREPGNGLQYLLAVTTHIGTGFVRRALSLINAMPVISGNCGAVRRDILQKIGGFSNIWGEDLDLTFKLHREHAKIVYDSDALVTCEVPSTIRALWVQRVRWTRSYIKVTRLHRDLMFSPAHFPFSWYLAVNWFNLLGIPLLQTLSLVLLPVLMTNGSVEFGGWIDIVAYLGFALFAAIAAYSIIIDRMPGHLLYLAAYGWLILPATYFYNGVVFHSLYAEALRRDEAWGKSERRSPWMLQLGSAPIKRFALRFGGPVLACVVAGFIFLNRPATTQPQIRGISDRQISLTLATHFDAWEKPRDAITSVLDRDHAETISSVAVGAGRWEWNFFAWKGHEGTWSNDQRMSRGDMLEDAIRMVAPGGKKVVAIIDFYAPSYLTSHPGKAAIDIRGDASKEQVCFMELVRGEYGRGLIEMAAYLARSYDIDAVSLTELQYSRYCYDERCRASYTFETGKSDWPRSIAGGAIDPEAASVGRWRSRLMTAFLRELADSVHAYGKRVYIDVPVDFPRLREEGLSSGLYYPELVRISDALIVWDYFYLDARPPESSAALARYFVDRFGSSKVIISMGLWGKEKPISPEELAESMYWSVQGGARQLWITPNHLVTPAHWSSILRTLQTDHGRVGGSATFSDPRPGDDILHRKR